MIEQDYNGLTAEQWANAYKDLHRRYRHIRDKLKEIEDIVRNDSPPK